MAGRNDNTSFGDLIGSLPNTLYLAGIGVFFVVAAVGLEVGGLSVEAGLTLSLGLFLVVLGLFGHAIFWSLGFVESLRL